MALAGLLEIADRAFQGIPDLDVEIDVHELSMLLEGIDVTRVRASARWEAPGHARLV